MGIDELAFRTWYDEAEPVESGDPIKDPYHRVDAIHSDRHVQVYSLDGTLLADSKKPVVVFETGFLNRYYLPREDVINADTLSKDVTGFTTVCPYKGLADYHDGTSNFDSFSCYSNLSLNIFLQSLYLPERNSRTKFGHTETLRTISRSSRI